MWEQEQTELFTQAYQKFEAEQLELKQARLEEWEKQWEVKRKQEIDVCFSGTR
jgi:hypothetical protein